ncbi:MAG TPA: hypothetical protein VG943_13885 [Caulobacterales bacterium]|nr:hypothetical protein [Caulobacterales bacterium]
MELLDYQKVTKLTWRALEKQIGVKHSNLNAIAHGRRDCSQKTARAIEDKTSGAVTANDLNKARRRFLEEEAKRYAASQSEARA